MLKHDKLNQDNNLSFLAQAFDEPTELDLGRLRRSVGRALPGRSRGSVLTRLSAMAACLALLVATAAVMQQGERATLNQVASVEMHVDSEGRVIFEFADGSQGHRVQRVSSPQARLGDPLQANGTQFVHANGMPEPGTAVFYRID